MKIEVTDLSPVKKKMSIEVPPDVVEQETRTVLQGYAGKVKVPGFRAGKVPLSVVRARFGKEVNDDVRERVVSRAYEEAAREKGLRPLGNPTLDELKHEEGESLTFETTFEVLPPVELKSYKGIELRRSADEVAEDEVDKALESLRESRANLVTEEGRKASTGDVIVADVEGEPAEGEPFQRERMMIELGGTDNIPAFNDNLEGAAAGEEREFTVDYPAEYGAQALAGKAVKYKLTVHEVKVRQVPELDDEFAKDLGDFDDLAALRAKAREDLVARRKADNDRQLRESLLDKLLMDHAMVLPEVLVEDEIRHRLEDLARNLLMQGIDPEKAEVDWADMRKRQEEPARRSVHARLLLDEVARAESLTVEPAEVEARIRKDAEAMGEKPEKLKAGLRKHNRMEALKNQLLREKSLDLMLAVANIQ